MDAAIAAAERLLDDLPAPRGICALTVQRGSLVGTLVWDAGSRRVLPGWHRGRRAPRAVDRPGGWRLTYARDLAALPPAPPPPELEGASYPFCCGEVRLEEGSWVSTARYEYGAFLAGRGTLPHTVFHVVARARGGSLAATHVARIEGGCRRPAPAAEHRHGDDGATARCARHHLSFHMGRRSRQPCTTGAWTAGLCRETDWGPEVAAAVGAWGADPAAAREAREDREAPAREDREDREAPGTPEAWDASSSEESAEGR
jgi:hypothetical protein